MEGSHVHEEGLCAAVCLVLISVISVCLCSVICYLCASVICYLFSLFCVFMCVSVCVPLFFPLSLSPSLRLYLSSSTPSFRFTPRPTSYVPSLHSHHYFWTPSPSPTPFPRFTSRPTVPLYSALNTEPTPIPIHSIHTPLEPHVYVVRHASGPAQEVQRARHVTPGVSAQDGRGCRAWRRCAAPRGPVRPQQQRL